MNGDCSEELNKLLPVIKTNREEISKPSSSIDPVFKVGCKRYRPSALTVDDLPEELEAILISYNHFDHLDFQKGEKFEWTLWKQTPSPS